MIVNFINPNHYNKNNKNNKNENEALKSTSYDRYGESDIYEGNKVTEINNNIYTLCIISSFIFILYFILIVPMFFIDIIIASMYQLNDSICKEVPNPTIKIDKWLFVNGIMGYTGLGIIICLKRIYTEEGITKRMIKAFGYVINFFLLIWSGFGITLFFKEYYGKIGCFSLFSYNYILIRLILSPIVGFFKLIEVYCS
jgi:hypothetical protein